MYSGVQFTIIILMPIFVKGDYECLCSYKVEMPVNLKADRDSGVIGYMYEFGCKPTVKVTGGPPQKWQTIAYEQQLGYVYLDTQVNVQICPGTPSSSDLLTTQSYVSTTTTSQTTTQSTTVSTAPTSIMTTAKPSTTTTMPTSSTTTPSTTPTTTTVKPTTTPGPTTLGDVRLCPHTLHQYTIEDQGALGQFGDSCYEIVPIRTTWLKAEKDCVAKGGHLFHVSNQREQDFILLFINSNQFAHACWMGFHDLIREEMFEWTSGDNVTYTNWWHDRKGNFFSHHTEDCVLFVPYSPYFGKWDDVQCGSTNVLGVDQGQINPFICQFPIHGHYTYVPLSSGFGKRQTRAK